MKKIFILFILSTVHLSAQNKFKILMADASFQITPLSPYKFNSIEFNYTQSSKNGHYHWFVEVLKINYKTVSAFNITSAQHQYSAGLGVGDYTSDKLLDIFTFRYDLSFGFKYNYIPILPEAVYEVENLDKSIGFYLRPSICFTAPLFSKFSVFSKLSLPFSLDVINHYYYSPSITLQQRKSVTPELDLDFNINFGLQYKF